MATTTSLEDLYRNGLTPGRYIVTAATNQDSTVISAVPGRLGHIEATNINAAVRYLKLYDKATAPTSSDTPVYVIALQGGATGTSASRSWPVGLTFSVGIAFRVVTGIADNDANAATTQETVVSWGYR